MGGAYSKNGRYEKCIQSFRKPEGKNQLENLDIDGMIILKRILQK
jgi:hypothetical protein